MSVRVCRNKIGSYYWAIINSHGKRVGNSYRQSSDKGFVVRQARMIADKLGVSLEFSQ